MSSSSPELNFDPLAAYKKDRNNKAYQEGYERIFGKNKNASLAQQAEQSPCKR